MCVGSDKTGHWKIIQQKEECNNNLNVIARNEMTKQSKDNDTLTEDCHADLSARNDERRNLHELL